MKQAKKTIALLLTLILLLSAATVGVCAEDGTQDVLVTITTDKKIYALTDIATVIVQVTNNSDKTLQNVVLGVDAEHWVLAGRRESNVLEAGDLQPGETATLTFRCMLERGLPGLCFFCRLALFMKHLFRGTTAFKTVSYPEKSCTVATEYVNHNIARVNITATAWYETLIES